jgi:hypothetical protein
MSARVCCWLTIFMKQYLLPVQGSTPQKHGNGNASEGQFWQLGGYRQSGWIERKVEQQNEFAVL